MIRIVGQGGGQGNASRNGAVMHDMKRNIRQMVVDPRAVHVVPEHERIVGISPRLGGDLTLDGGPVAGAQPTVLDQTAN